MTAIMLTSGPASADQPPGVYTVKDGNKVDDKTLEGWKTWRAMACERCHGPEQEGLVGPSLVNSLKVLSKDEFHTTITHGRLEKGMPNFGGVELVNRELGKSLQLSEGPLGRQDCPGTSVPADSG